MLRGPEEEDEEITYLMTRGHAIVRDVKRQPVVVKVRAHPQDSPSGIYGSKSGSSTCFPPSIAVVVLLHQFSILMN